MPIHLVTWREPVQIYLLITKSTNYKFTEASWWKRQKVTFILTKVFIGSKKIEILVWFVLSYYKLRVNTTKIYTMTTIQHIMGQFLTGQSWIKHFGTFTFVLIVCMLKVNLFAVVRILEIGTHNSHIIPFHKCQQDILKVSLVWVIMQRYLWKQFIFSFNAENKLEKVCN